MLLLSRKDIDDTRLSALPTDPPIICYRNRQYAIRHAYAKLQDAVRRCREDLDQGLFSIVVCDQDRFGVWGQLSGSGSGVG